MGPLRSSSHPGLQGFLTGTLSKGPLCDQSLDFPIRPPLILMMFAPTIKSCTSGSKPDTLEYTDIFLSSQVEGEGWDVIVYLLISSLNEKAEGKLRVRENPGQSFSQNCGEQQEERIKCRKEKGNEEKTYSFPFASFQT